MTDLWGENPSSEELPKARQRKKMDYNYLLTLLTMGTVGFTAGTLFGGKYVQRIAGENYSQYEARLDKAEKKYTSLKEAADGVATGRANLERELENLRTTKASREVALALLNKYGHSKLAEEAVLECDYKNNLKLDSNFPTILCKELDEIVEDARSGYLEHILLHRIEPKENLEGISRKYNIPLRVVEKFNNVLFNGYEGFPDESFSTVKDMTNVRGFGVKSKIIAGKYIAIPVYRRVMPLPPAPPAPEAEAEVEEAEEK